jgi:surface antigen
MNSTPTLDPKPRAAFWTARYLLHHCEGFVVDTDEGHLGYVAEVEEIDNDTIELIVAGPGGTYRVSSRAIRQFDPEAERIAIAGAPGRLGGPEAM